MGIWIDVGDYNSDSDSVFVQEYNPAPGEIIIDFGTQDEKKLYRDFSVKPGMRMLLADFVMPEGVHLGFEIERAPIELCYNFLGRTKYSVSKGRGHAWEIQRQPGYCLLSQLPQTHGTMVCPPFERIFSLSLFFNATVFEELFQDWPDALEHLGRNRVPGPVPSTMVYEQPIDPRSLVIIDQIMRCPYHGMAAALFMEAKSLELVAVKLDAISGKTQEKGRNFSEKDWEAVRHAYHILLDQCQSVPSLEDLCRIVGINRNKLNRGFREMFGDTVFGVAQKARLCRAWSLLEQSDLSLVEIALETGYKTQAGFTTAFCKCFGCTPGALRRN